MVPRIEYSLVKQTDGNRYSQHNLTNVMIGDKHRILRTQKGGFH